MEESGVVMPSEVTADLVGADVVEAPEDFVDMGDLALLHPTIAVTDKTTSRNRGGRIQATILTLSETLPHPSVNLISD